MDSELKEYIEQEFYFTPLLVKRLQEQLEDRDVLFVLRTMDGICHHCWDADSDCQCWNDE